MAPTAFPTRATRTQRLEVVHSSFHRQHHPYKYSFIHLQEFVCEPDASSASYALGMAAITGGCVTVQGLGAASLQGDARFARFLQALGCTVQQDEHSTMVARDVHRCLAAVDADLGDITDTFMTAAVLLATAPRGTTSRITGIANQRVKECNRIKAMATELAKCGVVCRELETGIEIEGAGREPPEILKSLGAAIECYGDHRIAMSFAVLGTLWPNIRILDKDCVEKTYPSFWDDINTAFQGAHLALPYSPDTDRAAQLSKGQRR
jgi:pentafunctional AROM polypeptide